MIHFNSREYEGQQDDNWVTLAVFAQEENLEQQLQWGVRKLDIRVAYCMLLIKCFYSAALNFYF